MTQQADATSSSSWKNARAKQSCCLQVIWQAPLEDSSPDEHSIRRKFVIHRIKRLCRLTRIVRTDLNALERIVAVAVLSQRVPRAVPTCRVHCPTRVRRGRNKVSRSRPSQRTIRDFSNPETLAKCACDAVVFTMRPSRFRS